MNELKGILSGKQISTYTFQEFLGGGAFGQVYRAVGNAGDIVAIKVISLTSLLEHNGLVKQLLIEEVDSMAKIDNPNVVKILNYVESTNNCYLIMEYCGNLKDLLKKNSGQFPQEEALSIFKQISNGIMGLHEKHIMHRDLKLENIFLHQGQQVKIGDLGFSKKLQNKDDMDDLCLGTLGYMAPEVAKNGPYGLSADIFSMGVILFEILYGRLPFTNYNFVEFISDVQRNYIDFDGNPSVTKEVIELLKAMLKEHPHNRITFYEMYKLPLFATKSLYIQGLTRISIITNKINFQTNKEFYEKSQFEPRENNGKEVPEQKQIRLVSISPVKKITQVQIQQNNPSQGIGIFDQSEQIKQQNLQIQQPQQPQQNQSEQQQDKKKLTQNYYNTPQDYNNALKTYTMNQNLFLPPDDEDQDQSTQHNPIISIQDEKLMNDLIQKYFDRFNSIQFLLNTLNELCLINFPSIFPIIYPQMILQKKAIVEFKKLLNQLQTNENIFQSPVHDKIQNKNILISLMKNLDEQIKEQENFFKLHYKAQVDYNIKKIQRYVQNKWLKDNQIEPSAIFNQNYQEALELIQDVLNTMKKEKTFPLLTKFEGHLKRCLDFEQLFKEKVQLSMEFDLK